MSYYTVNNGWTVDTSFWTDSEQTWMDRGQTQNIQTFTSPRLVIPSNSLWRLSLFASYPDPISAMSAWSNLTHSWLLWKTLLLIRKYNQ